MQLTVVTCLYTERVVRKVVMKESIARVCERDEVNIRRYKTVGEM